MRAEKHPHAWSTEALLAKAQRYAAVMLDKERTDWQFGFWSALTLEMLARAALAKISPALLADGKDWNNTYYSLGHTPTAGKFVPRSIDIAEVFRRLEAILPEFTREIHNFCSTHINLRNTELHSGDLPFDGKGTASWLSNYYLTCQVLLKSQGERLTILLGSEEATIAATLILSLEDKTAKAVGKIVATHKDLWGSKTDKERILLGKQAATLTSRHLGHRVVCPSCGKPALLHGTSIGVPTKLIADDIIVERQSMLPSHFECFACGLKIAGYSKLNACGLGDAFIATLRYEAAKYFEIPDPSEVAYEEDFNE